MTTYSLPTIARLLNSRWGRSNMPPMFYMTDEVRTPNPIHTINNLVPRTGVIFRHYNIKSRLELAIKVKRACRKNRCLFIVSGDTSLAVKLNADGLHLPEYLALNPPLTVRLWRQRPNKILTVAAHCQKTLIASMALHVDAALLSPVFLTNSHLNKNSLGVFVFQKMTRQSQLPVYALGGVNNQNAIQLINCQAIGIAGTSAPLSL